MRLIRLKPITIKTKNFQRLGKMSLWIRGEHPLFFNLRVLQRQQSEAKVMIRLLTPSGIIKLKSMSKRMRKILMALGYMKRKKEEESLRLRPLKISQCCLTVYRQAVATL